MTTVANLIFWGTLAFCGLMLLLALTAGLWLYAGVALVVGGLFAFSAPFVLGARWRPPAPRPTRRPVVRRRR